jgi:hypothetical protein
MPFFIDQKTGDALVKCDCGESDGMEITLEFDAWDPWDPQGRGGGVTEIWIAPKRNSVPLFGRLRNPLWGKEKGKLSPGRHGRFYRAWRALCGVIEYPGEMVMYVETAKAWGNWLLEWAGKYEKENEDAGSK